MRLTEEGIRALLDDAEVVDQLGELHHEITYLQRALSTSDLNLIADAKRCVTGELYALLQLINHKTRRGLSDIQSPRHPRPGER